MKGAFHLTSLSVITIYSNHYQQLLNDTKLIDNSYYSGWLTVITLSNKNLENVKLLNGWLLLLLLLFLFRVADNSFAPFLELIPFISGL